MRLSLGSVLARAGSAALLMGGLAFGLGSAFAEPLVKMEGGQPKPGVIAAWTGADKKVELTVAGGHDPQAVASTIEANVEKVKAKVTAGKVVVTGRVQEDLLKALAEVDFGGDDLGALAAAAMRDDDGDAGSSLRAKKTAELAKLLEDAPTTAMGKVTAVDGTTFPDAVISVRVLRAPTGELGKKVRKGQVVKFRPVFAKKGGALDLSDTNTQTNLGAWYLEKNDNVRVKIGKDASGTFEALLISR